MPSIGEIPDKPDVCIHEVPLKHRSGVTIVNVKPLFSYDSQNVMIASGSDIKVFSIKSGESLYTMKYHTTPIIGLQESKRNMLQIYSCSEDGIVVRWDYTGTILQVYKLGLSIACFYAPYPQEEWFITRQYENQHRLYSLTPKSNSSVNLKLIQKPVLPKENTVDCSIMHKFLASVYENRLVIYLLESRKIIGHMIGGRNFTCVACHPSNPILATGDDLGRVILWSDALHNNHPIKSIYHWHTLPVADLAFSAEGSHVYSGGGESALVKWNLFSEEKHVLPRLGAPIEHIVPSKDNSFLITTHSDNVLQVISAQRNIVQVIQGLTRCTPMYDKILPVGLLYNSHLKTLVMNGKPGHMQFFDLNQGKLLFNLDIAAKNFMSQDRNLSVFNIDVQKAAMDDSGLWLVTSEYWCNNEVSPQIWLKFWEYNLEKQMFALNTNVYMPHNQDLNCIAFRPSCNESDNSQLVVTTSNDGCFKLWTLNTVTNENKPTWGCEFAGHYRDMIPVSASFCHDGSVLAISFECVAVLWCMENLTLKAVLVNRKSQENIKQLLFGRHDGSKYLICHNGVSITAWDCTSLSMAWIVSYEIQTLVLDPYSDNIAAFCKDQNLKIFKPSSPLPLDYILKVSSSPVVSGVFVPSSTSNGINGCFKEKSQLYFIDANQNLITVTDDHDNEEQQEEGGFPYKKTVAQNISETPFGLLQASQIVSDVKPTKVEQFNISSKRKCNIIPNPTWQDPKALLKAILPTLLIKEEDETTQKSELQKENITDGKEGLPEDSCLIDRDPNWLSKALSNMEIKQIDFSFITNNVKFSE